MCAVVAALGVGRATRAYVVHGLAKCARRHSRLLERYEGRVIN